MADKWFADILSLWFWTFANVLNVLCKISKPGSFRRFSFCLFHLSYFIVTDDRFYHMFHHICRNNNVLEQKHESSECFFLYCDAWLVILYRHVIVVWFKHIYKIHAIKNQDSHFSLGAAKLKHVKGMFS